MQRLQNNMMRLDIFSPTLIFVKFARLEYHISKYTKSLHTVESKQKAVCPLHNPSGSEGNSEQKFKNPAMCDRLSSIKSSLALKCS